MKLKILFSVIAFVCTISANAQFYGTFGYGDPDAWFDKEIYFTCKNEYSAYGYGQNLSNVSIVINEETQYNLSGIWGYGTYLYVGKEIGIELSGGDTVAVYVGNQYIDSWTCPSSALPNIKFRGSGKVLKKLWSKAKKIRI